MIKTKKSATRPSVKVLTERIEQASQCLTELTMTLDNMGWVNGVADRAVRILQGKNYKKFVANAIAKEDPDACGSDWYTGEYTRR